MTQLYCRRVEGLCKDCLISTNIIPMVLDICHLHFTVLQTFLLRASQNFIIKLDFLTSTMNYGHIGFCNRAQLDQEVGARKKFFLCDSIQVSAACAIIFSVLGSHNHIVVAAVDGFL